MKEAGESQRERERERGIDEHQCFILHNHIILTCNVETYKLSLI